MYKRWSKGRLHVFAGRSDRYGLEATIDFNDGWGLILMLWNFYLVVEWWAND